MLLYTFLSRDDLDIIHCLPETLPVENVVNLCAVVAGTVGNQVGYSLSEAGISHNQVVCQGKLQLSISILLTHSEYQNLCHDGLPQIRYCQHLRGHSSLPEV